MIETCIVVADGARARLFRVDSSGESCARLVETEDLVNSEYQARGKDVLPAVRSTRNTGRQSGPVHPYGQRRLRHRLELERRFAREVMERTSSLTQSWQGGSVILIAEPRMLGLLREAGRGVFKGGVAVKELARDYTQLPVAELYGHLIHSGIMSDTAARS